MDKDMKFQEYVDGLDAQGVQEVKSRLAALPYPLNQQLLSHHFNVGSERLGAWYVIPRNWLELSNKVWDSISERLAGPRKNIVGIDISYCDENQNHLIVLTPRCNDYFYTSVPRVFSSFDSVRRGDMVEFLSEYCHEDTTAFVCSTSVPGTLVEEVLNELCNIEYVDMLGQTDVVDRLANFGFDCLRSAMYWKLREDLDPEKGTGVGVPFLHILNDSLCKADFEVLNGGKIRVNAVSGAVADSLLLAYWGNGK